MSGISLKKRQAPPQGMEAKRAEIEGLVIRNRQEIKSEQMVVFFIDECHLHAW